MKRKHKRLTFVGVALVLLAGAAALVLSAFEENIVFFMSPTDIAANKVSENQRFRNPVSYTHLTLPTIYSV